MIEISGLYKRYHRQRRVYDWVLEDINLTIPQGVSVGLLGRNGAGKSTTIKSIMRLVRCDSGSVHFEGRDISRAPPHRIARSGLGYVPEDRRIFGDLTIMENLEVGRQRARDGAPQWTTEKLFELFPNLRERAQNLGRQMSGGEQQMLTIARTLMGNPRLVLATTPDGLKRPLLIGYSRGQEENTDQRYEVIRTASAYESSSTFTRQDGPSIAKYQYYYMVNMNYQ